MSLTAFSLTEKVAGLEPFDSIAESYDSIFTASVIGRTQRAQVTVEIDKRFARGSRVLELNCGTGEDAVALARRGVRVSAYDASAAMISVARRRVRDKNWSDNISLGVLQNENLSQLDDMFDGALSNFAGLNCCADWPAIAQELARLIRPGGHLLLRVMGRTCLWEMLYFLLQGKPYKAFRRLQRGPHTATVGASSFDVFYPSAREAAHAFSSGFALQGWRGVGVLVPPSYCEPHFRKRSRLLRMFDLFDRRFGSLPGVRCWADHVLLDFVRLPA
jgi:ubiquinone/menaquinone biosynthesis C-methylase UbiE